MTMALTREQLLELNRRLSMAACAVNGLLYPNREHPPTDDYCAALERIAGTRLAELQAAIAALRGE